ncbi:MAG: DUF4382 domain-containing protein [Gammaproteobacteria bacterium]|nr:DUF4382 domain-containing protein [Gammaproteobacteria bacterium]
MLRRAIRGALITGLTAGLAACGGGGGSASNTPPGTMATMALTMSDASADDWACVGVRVLSIALVPAGGGSPVTVWSAPTPAPYVNLEQLDQLGEILGNVSVPVGTYSGALLTIAANPGDVVLTVAADPQSGFPLAGGTNVPADAIQIQGAKGSAGSLTVGVNITFDEPLTVSASTSNALDLEFDLAHPAFIVGHTPPAAAGATLWAVNFNGPVRRLAVPDIARLVLRHTYGTVSGVDSDSLTITKDFAVYPATNPETAIAGTQSLTIDADATNGTIVYDLDAGTRTVVDNFSGESSLNGRYVRIAARYQENGTLVAVRVWASSEFSKVWLSPEGHVLHVDTTNDVLTVLNEDGRGVPVTVNASTQFFFRAPANGSADATPIATGTAFLTNHDLVRGFKVHVSSMDPLAVPMVADTIDIETAAYGGHISNVTTSGFTYQSAYLFQSDNYSVNLGYIADTLANGFDDSGNPIEGFKWWNFTFPTTLTFGSGATSSFAAATAGAVDFGGTVGSLPAWGGSVATWGDGGANPSGWYARDAVLVPTPMPLGSVSTAFAASSFAFTVAGGTMPVAVEVSTTMGSATLVYQIDRNGGVVTVSPIDITTAQGLGAITSGLVDGAPVKVYGVPQAPVAPGTSGTLKAYVIVYYTGTMPSM